MLSSVEFRELVSGRRRGFRARLLRFGLRMVEVPYTWAVRWRNRRFDTGKLAVHWVAVPVVSVGNLTLGGTGKTPMVHWVARWFCRNDVRTAILSRGYGAEAGAPNDEALELKQRLPDVPHIQNPNRVEAAELAIEELHCQVIVLDDGFQHRRLHRDLDVVMLDSLEPFGFGHVFPRGTLREPIEGLRRADVVVLSRADLLERGEREQIRAEISRHCPQAIWAEVTHAPRELISADGIREPVQIYRRQPVAAFCGIGNPAGFEHTLTRCGYRLVAFREFPDHHPYRPADVEQLSQWADRLDVAAVLCTHKDLVKINAARLGRHRLWAVAVDIDFLSGQELLEARLRRLLPSHFAQ